MARTSKHPRRINVHVSDDTAERIEALRRHHGDATLGKTARRAIVAGIDALEDTMDMTHEYRQAGCFDDDAIAALIGAGVSPEQAAEYVEWCGSRGTLGYWVANRDLDAETAASYCRVLGHDCSDLDQLADDIYDARQLLADNNVDGSDLQRFGGDEPDDTAGVWSWDATRMLVGDGGWGEMEIVAR